MKIEGVIEAEGVKLHIDVDVPDDQEEVYITNVHPNCFVVPKERWRIEFLGLPPEVSKKLQDRGILFLGQLNHENGEGAIGLDENETRAVSDALKKLGEMAIIFEGVDGYEERTMRAVKRLTSAPPPKPIVGLETDIAVVKLKKEQEEFLFKSRGVKTLADLVGLGRSRILMTAKMDESGIEKIEAALRKAGAVLPD